MLDVESAKLELQTKTLEQIQKDTAMKWAARACAACQFADMAANPEELMHWMLDAHEYYHEALEHASLVNEPDFSDLIKKAVNFPARR